MTRRMRAVGLLMCLLVLPGLQTAAQGQAGQGRGNGLRTAFRTFYTPKTELFATYIPFVVNQPSRVTAHLTRITDRFEAVANAKVTVTLTVDGVNAEQTITAPARSGVFRAMLTPTKAGTGTLVVDVATQEGTEKFTIDNVTVESDLQTALAHQPADPDAGAIRYTKEEGWDSGNFATESVRKLALASGRPAVVAVTKGAVVQEQGQSRVYVLRNPEAFDLKPVKTGARTDQFVEITEGLREGDRVVVQGADKMPRN